MKNKNKNDNKNNNKNLKKDIEELSKELKTEYLKNEDLNNNFNKLKTQSGEQLKRVIEEYERDLNILRMRIRNINTIEKIKPKQKTNYIDKYNRIDKYIDNTIYSITGIKRDFKQGIHNNINAFNQLKNIDEILKKDFNITKQQFKIYFKNIKNLRLQQAHEDISHIGNKDLKNMILEDMIF